MENEVLQRAEVLYGCGGGIEGESSSDFLGFSLENR